MSPKSSKQRLGLVLSGGGARAAYQAGALRALAEISPRRKLPFPVLSGVSAGAINVAYLACHAEDFRKAAEKLWEMWEGLTEDRIFRVNRGVASLISARWVADVVLHRLPLVSGPKPEYLLDASPLLALLHSNLDFDAIKTHIRSGTLRGVAFSTTNYDTGTAVTFFDGHPSIEPWLRQTHIGVREDLTPDQVAASTAMPIFFPPVVIGGNYYGDGCIRMTTPLSPALHMGADRILAIGTHCHRDPEAALAITKGKVKVQKKIKPSIADVFGVLISAVFLDALELDLERLVRTNESIHKPSKNLRKVSAMALQPVNDLGTVARGVGPPLPFRHLLYALGAASDRSIDILSFLAFEKTYTSELLKLGYRDAMRKRAQLKKFLSVA